MSDFLLYWKPSTVDALPSDQTHSTAASDQFSRVGLKPGDVLWAVTSRSAGDLRLIARIGVHDVAMSREHAEALAGGRWLWSDANEFAIGDGEDARTAQDIDLSEVARRLVFEGGVDRLPRNFTGQHLQSMRRLSAESAALLERAWTEGEIGRPPRFNWQRDELILALDLYIRAGRRVLDETDSQVIALSQSLRGLPIHPERDLDPTFRNPNGVGLKLANFRAIESPGTGMARGNRLEQVVWDEFASDPERLRRVAQAIADGAVLPEAAQPEASQEEEEEFEEGRVAFRRHRFANETHNLSQPRSDRCLPWAIC